MACSSSFSTFTGHYGGYATVPYVAALCAIVGEAFFTHFEQTYILESFRNIYF